VGQLQASGALTTWAVVVGLVWAQEPGVQLRAVRFYRSAGSLTLVDAFCRVPVSAVSALSAGAAYRVSVAECQCRR